MLQASRGSTRIGAAVAALLGADLVSQLGRLEVNRSYYLSTPNRVSGDTLGQGLLVHKLNFEPTRSDPLGDPIASLPATEPVAASPNPTNESCRRREARGLVDLSLRCPTPPRSPTPPPRATRSGPARRPRRIIGTFPARDLRGAPPGPEAIVYGEKITGYFAPATLSAQKTVSFVLSSSTPVDLP